MTVSDNQVNAIEFVTPTATMEKQAPKVFENLKKAGYFPAERRLVRQLNGKFVTDLTHEEFGRFAAMLGVHWIHEGENKS
jgi:hypothetical protein